MVNLTINNKKVQVPEGTTILAAAAQVGIKIPTLCYLKEINEIASCRICVVEVEGKETLVASCNTVVEEGMVIYTNSYKAQHARRMNLQFILSEHDAHCASCIRSGNCSLQSVANDMNIGEVPFEEHDEVNDWPQDFPLIRNASKCIKCMRCVPENGPALVYPAERRLQTPTVQSVVNVSHIVRLVRCMSVMILIRL